MSAEAVAVAPIGTSTSEAVRSPRRSSATRKIAARMGVAITVGM